MVSMIGLVLALILLMVFTIRGMNLLISAPLCAIVVALTGRIKIIPTDNDSMSFVTVYMDGFAGFLSSWFFMFLLGSLFGKFMEESGAADRIAASTVAALGMRNAVAAIVIACAVLTYGGVSLFVVAFSVYPMALSLFKQANLPRRFIPAVMAFGSVTFTMTSAGSPEIQNWIPIKYLGTSPYAGWEVSIVVALFMIFLGYWWLNKMIRKALLNGEVFSQREGDPQAKTSDLPAFTLSVIPIVAVLLVTFVFHKTYAQYALILALSVGCLCAWGLVHRTFLGLDKIVSQGTLGALLAIANTAAVVGFGTVAKASPAFPVVVDAITGLPGNGLLGAAIAVTTIAAMTGSASGGQSIALPVLAPHYIDLGVDSEALHRVVAISSGALDTLPHNGYVVTTIRAICGETHQAAYFPMAALTVVVPLLGTLLALILFTLF
ncbi:GntP family permease [Agarilytica rhodophyticola]|uniref:GntP family permease n=1 Tax=Agarilytica rhodophyticola TaxID=1737490 RepID=UPI000B347CDD|nr:GntP family permease [Agarilytica rhodophyticola]